MDISPRIVALLLRQLSPGCLPTADHLSLWFAKHRPYRINADSVKDYRFGPIWPFHVGRDRRLGRRLD